MGHPREFYRAHRMGCAIAMGIAIYVLITAILYWPIGPFDASHLPDGGQADQGGAIWALAWVPYAITHGLNIFHTNYIDYPAGANLAQTPPAQLLGLIAAPVTYMFGPIASFNFLTELSFVVSATSMFLVLRQWCRHLLPAFLGGLFYGFNPYMVSQAHDGGHVEFLFMPLLPIMLWCLYDIFITQTHHPWRMGLLFGLLTAGEANTALEIVSDLGIVVAIAVVVLAIVHRDLVRARLRYIGQSAVAACGIFFPLVAWEVWETIFGAGHIIGPTQPVLALQSDRVNLYGAFIPLSNQLVAPTHLATAAAKWVGGNLTENGAYLGIPLVIVLAVFALWWRKEPILRVSIGMAIVAYVLSLGNRLDIGASKANFPLPESFLMHISLLDNTVPARFSLIVTPFVAIALAVGIEKTLDYVKALPPASIKRFSIASSFAGAFVVASLLPRAPFPQQTLAWATSVNTVINTIPSGSVVLSYPYPMPFWPEPMVWQAQSEMRFKLLGGYENVAEPNGTSSVEAPLLLAPPYVEEYLTQSQFGGYWFPAVGRPTAANEAELCTFIKTYSVNAIIDWKVGAAPLGVSSYFTTALGDPTTSNDQVALWLHPASHCT